MKTLTKELQAAIPPGLAIELLKEMEDKGETKIVGAFYRLTDGTLEFIN